jgi:protein regulator of cytokinesis 1
LQAKRLDTVLAQVKRVHNFCSVMGEDFSEVIQEVHPSLKEGIPHNKSVSSETLRRLDEKVAALLEEKKRRMLKVGLRI